MDAPVRYKSGFYVTIAEKVLPAATSFTVNFIGMCNIVNGTHGLEILLPKHSCLFFPKV